MAALIGLVKLGPQTPFSGGFTVGADEGEGVAVGVGVDEGRSARWTAGPDREGVISWAIASLESVAAAPVHESIGDCHGLLFGRIARGSKFEILGHEAGGLVLLDDMRQLVGQEVGSLEGDRAANWPAPKTM